MLLPASGAKSKPHKEQQERGSEESNCLALFFHPAEDASSLLIRTSVDVFQTAWLYSAVHYNFGLLVPNFIVIH
jgi:hypothetical protein